MRKSVDPFLADVHALLRLPLRKPNIPSGCNFTVAHTLLGVVAGVSIAFYKSGLKDGEAFTGLLCEFYPWDLEGAADAAERSKVLWRTFRNPFAHSLGMPFEGRQGNRELRPRGFQLKIGRGRPSMKERDLVAFERSVERPMLKPTVVIEPHKRVLWVEALYWGTRKMVYRLSSNTALMDDVEQRFSASLARHEARPKP